MTSSSHAGSQSLHFASIDEATDQLRAWLERVAGEDADDAAPEGGGSTAGPDR